MNDLVIIYVFLLDEGVDVWRPISAVHLQDDVYRIVAQPYDQTDEKWQFEPGDTVICRPMKSEDGEDMLVAYQRG